MENEQHRRDGHSDRHDRQAESNPPATGPLAGVVDDRLRFPRTGQATADLLHRVDKASITSTMIEVKVDRNGVAELHEQVAAEIRRAIALGEAVPGDRLPPAKDLAAVADVNKNTILRALRELRNEGLLDFQRGRGVRVSGTPAQSAVIERARELVRFAREQGYRQDELLKLIKGLG